MFHLHPSMKKEINAYCFSHEQAILFQFLCLGPNLRLLPSPKIPPCCFREREWMDPKFFHYQTTFLVASLCILGHHRNVFELRSSPTEFHFWFEALSGFYNIHILNHLDRKGWVDRLPLSSLVSKKEEIPEEFCL